MRQYLVVIASVYILWDIYEHINRSTPPLLLPPTIVYQTFPESGISNEELDISRDFLRYKCVDRKRLGGRSIYLEHAAHSLDRVEGSWFVCFDGGIALVKNSCTVLSFGVNVDETFDKEVNTQYGCQVESFDPFIESELFQSIRNKNQALANAVTLNVNSKWNFHRIGIVDEHSIRNLNQIGWMTSFKRILDYVKLTNKTIDIVKIDIEMGEWIVLNDLDVDYMCKYVKQFMLETHPTFVFPSVQTNPNDHLRSLRKFEKCFRLFHRDTRFFKRDDPYYRSEFQEPISHMIALNDFKTEIKLMDYMVTYGELYFVNKNFLRR